MAEGISVDSLLQAARHRFLEEPVSNLFDRSIIRRYGGEIRVAAVGIALTQADSVMLILYLDIPGEAELVGYATSFGNLRNLDSRPAGDVDALVFEATFDLFEDLASQPLRVDRSRAHLWIKGYEINQQPAEASDA